MKGNIGYIIAGVAILLLIFWTFKNKGAKPQEVKSMLDENALVVDVRTPGEFSMGHFPGAINIPVDRVPSSLNQFGEDKNRPIVVYCASGARSGGAQRFLSQQGYTNVVNGGGLHQMMSLR